MHGFVIAYRSSCLLGEGTLLLVEEFGDSLNKLSGGHMNESSQ